MIYITGDIHGDFEDFSSRKLKNLKKGDKLIVTGDFGFFWDNSKNEIKNREKLAKKKFDILFAEGAHENFDSLKQLPEADLYCGKGYKAARNIYCLKKGEIYTIEGKTIFTLGGGMPPYAIDGEGDCEKSIPTEDELKYAVENLRRHHKTVDIIITHEAPACVKRVIDKNATINELNLFLDTVLHNTSFKSWYFGSLHQDRAVTKNMFCVWQDIRPVLS